MTFYFNNAPKPIRLPKFDLGKVSINRGLNVDGDVAVLNSMGSLIVNG